MANLEHLEWRLKNCRESEARQIRTMQRLRECIAAESDPVKREGYKERLAEAESTFEGFKKMQARLESEYAEAQPREVTYGNMKQKGQER